MLYDCLILNYLYISQWDTSKITNISKMFESCENLSFPDKLKQNLINITDIKYMFYGCKFLTKLPDLSSWNTNNIKAI